MGEQEGNSTCKLIGGQDRSRVALAQTGPDVPGVRHTNPAWDQTRNVTTQTATLSRGFHLTGWSHCPDNIPSLILYRIGTVHHEHTEACQGKGRHSLVLGWYTENGLSGTFSRWISITAQTTTLIWGIHRNSLVSLRADFPAQSPVEPPLLHKLPFSGGSFVAGWYHWEQKFPAQSPVESPWCVYFSDYYLNPGIPSYRSGLTESELSSSISS